VQPPVSIAAATRADLAGVRQLAGVVWRRHYPGIITHAQIDYMLGRGYSDDALARFLDEPGAALALASVDGAPVGFAAWCRPMPAATTKLDKLYVLPERHGRGVGRLLVAHVEGAARGDGAQTLVLTSTSATRRRSRSTSAAASRYGRRWSSTSARDSSWTTT